MRWPGSGRRVRVGRTGGSIRRGCGTCRGRFDPETRCTVAGVGLRGATEVLAQGRALPSAPDDPLERHQWLQAQALASLIDGDIETAGGPEMLMVIGAGNGAQGGHERTVLDMCGFDLPLETIRRWACTSAITPVIVGLDGTRLMLGRTTRLATADQRQALAALYRTCGCCDTPFDRCRIHHVDWWERGGATDIDKMAPLCPRCHHLAHEGQAPAAAARRSQPHRDRAQRHRARARTTTGVAQPGRRRLIRATAARAGRQPAGRQATGMRADSIGVVRPRRP